jgi:hypothetical protein
MNVTVTVAGAKRPTRFLISSALRSKHSLIRPAEFSGWSNHDLGWARMRLSAARRSASTHA